MHITVLGIGTRGDVQPMLALAVGLQRTGRHLVRLIAPDDFDTLAPEHGLDFAPLGLNAHQLLGMGGIGTGLESGRNTLPWVWQILRTIRSPAGLAAAVEPLIGQPDRRCERRANWATGSCHSQ